MAFPHCSVTVKCHNKAKIVCPRGKRGKGTIFHTHTKGDIDYKAFPFQLQMLSGAMATLQRRSARSVRFKANVMHKSDAIYVNINYL